MTPQDLAAAGLKLGDPFRQAHPLLRHTNGAGNHFR